MTTQELYKKAFNVQNEMATQKLTDRWDYEVKHNCELDGKDKTNLESFKKELEMLINRYSIENIANMPDFILSETLCGIIQVLGKGNKNNLDWNGV